MNKWRTSFVAALAALALVLAGSLPASAGSGTFSDNICSATKTNATGWGKTGKTSGSCGTLSVNLQLQTNGGGPLYWSGWGHSSPGVSSFTKSAFSGSGVRVSDHGIRGLITVSRLSL